jgi:hypothetical protein
MAGLPNLNSLPQGIPLGTVGAMGSDFSPMMALLEMEFRRRQAAQPQLDMRNLLARQGLRGVIDPATGMPRPDPYGKIGGVLDQDLAAAQQGVGPVPTIRSTGPTLKQRREGRKQERTFERSLRRMGVEEREQALTERAQQDYEKMQARSLGGMEERRRRALGEAAVGRGSEEDQDFLDVAAQAREMERTTANVVSDRDRVRQIAANLRTVATQLPEGPERERRMRSIERWVREQEDRLEGREERTFQRSRIEKADARQDRAEERQERAFARAEAQAERAEMAETRQRNEQRGVDLVSTAVLPVVPFVDAGGSIVPLRDWETSALEAAQSAIMEATADPTERAAMLEAARARIAQEAAREHQRRSYEFQDQQQADARRRGARQEEVDFYNFTSASLQRIGAEPLANPSLESSRQSILSDSEDLMALIRNAPASEQPALYRQLGALALQGHMLRLRDTQPELQDADIQEMVGKLASGDMNFDEIAKRLGDGPQANARRARFFEIAEEAQKGMALEYAFEVARGERDPRTGQPVEAGAGLPVDLAEMEQLWGPEGAEHPGGEKMRGLLMEAVALANNLATTTSDRERNRRAELLKVLGEARAWQESLPLERRTHRDLTSAEYKAAAALIRRLRDLGLKE